MSEDKPLDIEKNVTMSDLTEGDILPEVNHSALAAMAEDHKAREKEQQEIQASGTKLKKDGTPAKKRGPKPKAEKSTVGGVKPKEESKQDEGAISSLYAATVTSALLEQVSVKLISDEWILSDTERASNVKAWEDCYNHYGGVNLSAPQALALNHLGIILTRVAQPKTLSKFQLMKIWIAQKFSKVQWKKKDNAYTDNRADDVRKDNVRDEKGAGVSG